MLPTWITRQLYRRRLTGWFKPNHADRFDLVCRDNRWGSAETVSGPGSERGSSSVEHVTTVLEEWIPHLGVARLGDVGCGDLNWQAPFLARHPDLDYAGYEVSPAIVQRNQTSHPDVRCQQLDITRSAPGPCDLILCKDVLNHLDERDVQKALANLARTPAKWLLVTSNRDATNEELSPRHPHGSRHLNLEAAPYALPEPVFGDHYLLLYRLDDLRAHMRGERVPFEPTPSSHRFSEVYQSRLWGSEESVSGPGSERSAGAVRHSLQVLDTVIREHGIRSMADIPCGDFNWMPELLAAHPDLGYVGYDVVPELIRENRLRYPARDFRPLDIAQAVPTRADLVFSKDLLNHLGEADVWAALENMVTSGAEWLLVTTNRGFDNVDLEPTQPHASRHLNLEAPPYSLPAPVSGDHYLLLYRMADVARRLAERTTS